MSSNVSLLGFSGMGPEFVLPTRNIGAGELIAEHALPLFHEANPGLDKSQLPLAWNNQPDAVRKGFCIQAFNRLQDASYAAAALDEQQGIDSAIELTAEKRLGETLLEIIMEQLQDLPRPWVSMTADQQDAVLERATLRVRDGVKETIRALSSRGKHHVVCTLDQITIKKGAKAVLSIPASLLDEHLLDSVGEPVILVLAGSLQEAEGIQKPAPTDDQAQLLLGIGGGQLDGGDGEPDNGMAQHSDPED